MYLEKNKRGYGRIQISNTSVDLYNSTVMRGVLATDDEDWHGY